MEGSHGLVVHVVLELLKLNIPWTIFVQPLVHPFDQGWGELHPIFDEHLTQVVRAQVEVFVAVELVKKFPHYKLVLTSLSLLD